MNETGQSFGSNPASLKGKLQTLEVRFSLIFSNKSKTSPTSWIIIRRKFRFSDQRRTLLKVCWLWRQLMSRSHFPTSWFELNKKWRDTSISKRRRTAESSNRLQHWKDRRQLCNSNCWAFRGGSQSWRCRWAVMDTEQIPASGSINW